MAIIVRIHNVRAINRLRYAKKESSQLKRLIMRRHSLGILTDDETTVLIHLHELEAA